MPIEFASEDRLEYQFFPNASGITQFRVRTSNDAHIALSPAASETTPMYEVFLGGWGNSKSCIRKNRTKPDVAEAPTPGILNGDEFRGFWIRWENGNISVGREGEGSPFLNFTDYEQVPIEYVGFCTGWGASGNWIVEEARGGRPSYGGGPMPSAPAQLRSGGGGGSLCWVGASNGQVPPRAFVGGEDNGEPIYVTRANFQGALIPGKLLASHGTSYVAWGGAENACSEYEVLVDFHGNWQATNGSNIPPNAAPAGQSEDGEPLYVGRVVHDGCLTIGKVQPSHGVLYIPFGGQELAFQDYEILVQ